AAPPGAGDGVLGGVDGQLRRGRLAVATGPPGLLGAAAGRGGRAPPAGPAGAPGRLQGRLRLLVLRQGPNRIRRQPVPVVPRPAPGRPLAPVLVVAAVRPGLPGAVPAPAAGGGPGRRGG